MQDEVRDAGDYLIECGERLGCVHRVVIAVDGLEEGD